jgi:cyclopropane fatty-acyl-phospholipid synthase-like methyltransferase
MKPYSEACDRNRDPILSVLKDSFTAPGTVLEIGSGTGQHAVYFARNLPHLQWIATDRDDNHPGIIAWMKEEGTSNLQGPLSLDVTNEQWPVEQADYIFSANTAHIMSWPMVQKMFAGVGRVLSANGVFCLYGPFNRDGEFTSESNRHFDAALKAREAHMGIRDDRELKALGERCGLRFLADHVLPANNRILVWQRV